VSRRTSKPIRVFWSPLSRRLYATRVYREVKPGVMACTGERFDVTNDIAAIMEQERIEFRRSEPDPPLAAPTPD
jgi:hypothetical protein